MEDEPVAAGSFDFVSTFFHTAWPLLNSGRTPKFHVRKTEHPLEARWCNDLFGEVQHGWDHDNGCVSWDGLMEDLATLEISLMKAMIEAGAAGVHFEDPLSSEKKCGHMGGNARV